MMRHHGEEEMRTSEEEMRTSEEEMMRHHGEEEMRASEEEAMRYHSEEEIVPAGGHSSSAHKQFANLEPKKKNPVTTE